MINLETAEKLATTAAKIWADTVRDGFSLNAGDALTNMALTMVKNQHPQPDEEKIQSFQEALAYYIMCDMEPDKELLLEIDYDPAPNLAIGKAIAKAGLENFSLPVKSNMWIMLKESKIEYSFGYGAEWKTVEV